MQIPLLRKRCWKVERGNMNVMRTTKTRKKKKDETMKIDDLKNQNMKMNST